MEKRKVQAPRPNIGEGSLRVGRLVKAHGLKGAIKIELYTDNPDLRFRPGAKFHLQVPEDSAWFGKQLELTELRWFNKAPVAFFKDIADRNAAETLIRAILWIDEAEVDAGNEDDAWYDQQLVGLDVMIDGKKAGEIIEVQHLPGQDLLAVRAGKETILVPFVSDIVPDVDIAGGKVVMTPPNGLFNPADAENAAADANSGNTLLDGADAASCDGSENNTETADGDA